MTGARILVVDDERPIRRFLRVTLEAHGYAAIEADTARRGIEAAALEAPDLVILDLGLPDMDGKAALARIREWSQVPVIVLSVRASEAEKVAALDAGAQDYVVKPFGVQELLARIRGQLRDRAAIETSATLAVGDLLIDAGTRQVRKGDRPVKLTRKEFDVLWMLASHPGRLVTHRMLLREIWGPAHEADTQYLRVLVRQLRQKIGDDAANPRYIANEPGVGYRIIE
jgi:two-component system, OmpR family, KDP operon response regulator KdpE